MSSEQKKSGKAKAKTGRQASEQARRDALGRLLNAASYFGSLTESELKRLLKQGADIDFVTKNANMSAAMFAAAENRAECLNVLRDAGCDLDIERTLDGKTAMQIHRETVQAEMRKVLGKA